VTETLAHRRLKRMALAHLRGRGCLAAAAEVRCPISRWRVDVAGYQDTPPRDRSSRGPRGGRPRVPPATVLVECKQCRGDFLRDQDTTEQLHRERRDLEAIARSIEEHHIKVQEPHLRRQGSSLFAELEEWEFAGSRLTSYRRVLDRLQRVEQRLYGQTKFCMIARYRLADRLYLAAPAGMIRRHELPAGWGLLECAAEDLEEPVAEGAPELRERVPAPWLSCDDRYRQRLLRNIAVAASIVAARRG
jgi:hypothetical protein